MNIYDFVVENMNGDLVSLKEYEGNVRMVVNSATRCGFTPQFAKVLVNGEFANPLFKYLKGEQSFKGFDPEHPLTSLLESMMEREHPNYKDEPDIKWNFTKFLVDRSGNVVDRFEPTTDFDVIRAEVEKYL